ncbi:disease resistance protein Roq1 [Cryptomeria japonica]|uniref:disease resistance protein Roq1 n=1 Tax=Cryptomeria japonica TaxID=3369 RepID=UPI0025AD1F93|nr:disease resistance protein Roq1 [Cryptomeria japonica]XP_057871115.1 disease resistance protein Roq1 [Cryptomeria japonica]XP_057871117.1 disease resistance protein Roq1 [Cryptomeria japonica]XP_057871118.1 disease resistance protein Roq1 [Cryptomeria japonica]XP_057871119.1 disease resistance protein Roq1 [Cryptomeria japonica]
MASSSSAIASPKFYDAFISQRDPNVKETLGKHLYLLQERGCQAFLDRQEIKRGDSIPFAIHNAICSSLVQIPIFSKGYAESKWCLDELVLMLEQPPADALFIPVVNDVKPWELRHIENHESRYAVAFSDYRSKGRYLDKLDEWRNALKCAADISGYELGQHQDELCEKTLFRVPQVVQERTNRAKYPVGFGELVQYFESCCSERKKQRKVRRAGIYGLGGSGKSTVAKELFNRKLANYYTSCFLSDVRESHARGELHCLQSQLLNNLFPKDPDIEGLEISSVRVRNLNFLVVLVDIDHQD